MMVNSKTLSKLNEVKDEIEAISSKMIASTKEMSGDIITIRSDPVITDLWRSLCRYHKKAMLLCSGLNEIKPEVCSVLETPQACVEALQLSEEEICCEVFKRRLNSADTEHNKVKYLMSSPVLTTNPESSVADIIELMRKHGIGSLAVTKKGKIMGIITEHDILSRIYSVFKDPRKTLAKQIMTKSPIITITPEADIKEATQLMSKNNIMHLPVIENGILVGMIAVPDFYQE